MIDSKAATERRLARLERVLATRQARLAASLVASPRRRTSAAPVGDLQRYGYPIAALLVAAAVLPTLLGVGWRHRKLVGRAAANGLAVRKLRTHFDDVRSNESAW